MNPGLEFFGLSSPDGRQAQLLSVQIQGELIGLMLRLTVRQTWRNASGAPMATRFDFPLAWPQTLLRMQALQHGQTLHIQRFERHGRLRCSTALGILQAGEQITLYWQVGQLLHLQGGSLRVVLPAALAPRASYPLKLGFEVHDPVAQGTLSCPSHDMQRVRHAQGSTLALRPQFGLEKDWVLTVHGLRERGFALASPYTELGELVGLEGLGGLGTGSGAGTNLDLNTLAAPSEPLPQPCTVLVSSLVRLPPLAAQGGQPGLRMKVLIDNSSAMPNEHWGPLVLALERALALFTPTDQLSLSRFGQQVTHDLPRLQTCTEAYVRRARALLRVGHGNLGTPQVLAALQQVLEIADEDEEPVSGVAVLLVTASPLWAIDEVLKRLHAAQHSLYVLQVGAQAQSLWPELAHASGGASQVLTPGQQVQPHLTRLIEHMRSQCDVQTDLRVVGAQVLRPGLRPARLSDGDTLHLWALVQAPPQQHDLAGCPQLQATLGWQREADASSRVTLTPLPVLWDASGDLARLCDANEARLRGDAPVASNAALPAAVTPALRAAATANAFEPPPASAPSPAPVAAPVTAPVGALAPAATHAPAPAPAPTSAAAPAAPAAPAAEAAPVAQTAAAAAPRAANGRGLAPSTFAQCLSQRTHSGNPLLILVQGFDAQAQTHGQYRAALSATLRRLPGSFLDTLVLQLSREAGSPARVWALLLHWLHAECEWPLQAQALALLQQELGQMPVTVRSALHTRLSEAAQAPHVRHTA